MRDIENYVINAINNAVTARYPSAEVSGDYVEQPANFPHVFVLQINKYDVPSQMSLTNIEHAQEVTFQIIVYSNKLGTAKTECKNIMDTVDETMHDMNFRLSYQAHVPNFDTRIYRLVRRYVGAVRGSYSGDPNIYMINPV